MVDSPSSTPAPASCDPRCTIGITSSREQRCTLDYACIWDMRVFLPTVVLRVATTTRNTPSWAGTLFMSRCMPVLEVVGTTSEYWMSGAYEYSQEYYCWDTQ